MSPKIFKKGEFDTSKITKFDKELGGRKIGTEGSQRLAKNTFEMNAHHSEKIAVFKDSQTSSARIIDDAKKEAEKILRAANEEADKTKKEAFAKGFQDGQARAVAESREYVADIVKDLSSITKELSGYREQLILDTEKQLLHLVTVTVNKIIVSKLDADDEIIVRVVKEAIKNLVDKEFLTIKINPADAEKIKSEKINLVQEFDGIKKFNIIEDESIKRGGCYIEAPSSDVDARIDKQIEIIKKTFESK